MGQHGYCNACKKELLNSTDYKFYRQKKYCLDCYEKLVEGNNKSDTQRKDLENYICELFGFEELPLGYSLQIDKFIKDYHFKPMGIKGSLYYFYEIMDNDIANDVFLGIVPNIYEESKNYFKEQRKIEEINQKFIKKDEKIIVQVKKPNGSLPIKSDIEGWK